LWDRLTISMGKKSGQTRSSFPTFIIHPICKKLNYHTVRFYKIGDSNLETDSLRRTSKERF
jgi:hypothetical protein